MDFIMVRIVVNNERSLGIYNGPVIGRNNERPVPLISVFFLTNDFLRGNTGRPVIGTNNERPMIQRFQEGHHAARQPYTSSVNYLASVMIGFGGGMLGLKILVELLKSTSEACLLDPS